MEKPRPINSGDAMRWNEDVERRRREYHEQRCAEEPLYRRAYERQQEMKQRINKMAVLDMLRLREAIGDEESAECRRAAKYGIPEKNTPEQAMGEVRAAITKLSKSLGMSASSDVAGNVLAFGVMAMLFDPEAAQRLKELEEERPYAEEIRKADENFDREMICLSGFEW